MKLAPIATALLSLACLTSTAQAGPGWAWLKPDGRCCEYSDRPPPASVPEKNIVQRPAAARRAAAAQAAQAASVASAIGASAPQAVDPELEARRKKEKDAQDAARKAEEEKIAKSKAENCARARQYQQTLDSGRRIGRTNEQGENEILDDAGRAQENERNRRILDANCN